MDICFLANAASVHTQRWARHFASRGYHVTVVSFQRGEIKGIPVFHLPAIFRRFHLDIFLNLAKIRRLVKEIAPDILHAHYATSYGLSGALTGKHPYVITAWGSDVLIMPEKSWAYRQIVRFAMRRADLVTSMAEHMTQHLTKRGYAVADKILTLPFGVDTEVFNPNQRTRSHGEGPSLIVSTRRLDHGMDVDTFIWAIPKVINIWSNVRFLLAGDGPLRAQLEQLTVDLGVAKSVEFLGSISHQQMARLLGKADVFVTTSPSDGNNISLNEAMACGAFPIVTDIPANRAWIEHGRNGLYFPCRDVDQLSSAIIKALRQPEWRQRVTAENWEIVCARASWSYQMAKMERYYHELLQRTIT